MPVIVLRHRVRGNGRLYVAGDVITGLDAAEEQRLVEEGYCAYAPSSPASPADETAAPEPPGEPPGPMTEVPAPTEEPEGPDTSHPLLQPAGKRKPLARPAGKKGK